MMTPQNYWIEYWKIEYTLNMQKVLQSRWNVNFEYSQKGEQNTNFHPKLQFHDENKKIFLCIFLSLALINSMLPSTLFCRVFILFHLSVEDRWRSWEHTSWGDSGQCQSDNCQNSQKVFFQVFVLPSLSCLT